MIPQKRETSRIIIMKIHTGIQKIATSKEKTVIPTITKKTTGVLPLAFKLRMNMGNITAHKRIRLHKRPDAKLPIPRLEATPFWTS